MHEEDRETLKEVSKLTQDIGRMIGSPKTDYDALGVLSESLAMIIETIETTRKTILVRSET